MLFEYGTRQILEELKWIIADENCIRAGEEVWLNIFPKLIKQAKLERAQRVVQAVSLMLNDANG